MSTQTSKHEQATQRVHNELVSHLTDGLDEDCGEWLVGDKDEFSVHLHSELSDKKNKTVGLRLAEADEDGKTKRVLVMKVELRIVSVDEIPPENDPWFEEIVPRE